MLRKVTVCRWMCKLEFPNWCRLSTLPSLIDHSYQAVTTETDMDIDTLEHSLQTTIRTQPALPASEDVVMVDLEQEEEVDTFSPFLASLAKEPLANSSFLSGETSLTFEQIIQAFTIAGYSSDKLKQISNLPLIGKSQLVQKPQYLSFLVGYSPDQIQFALELLR